MGNIIRTLTEVAHSPEYYWQKAGGGPIATYRSEDYDAMESGSVQHITFDAECSSVTVHNRSAEGGPNLYFYFYGLDTVPIHLEPGYSVPIVRGIASGCYIESDGSNAKWQVIVTL